MIWLFDLDNTLYPFDTGMYEHINHLMNQYLKKNYKSLFSPLMSYEDNILINMGTTLLEMMIHHGTNPDDFLNEIHFFTITAFFKKEPELIHFFENLDGKKYIFTNSPGFYAKKSIICSRYLRYRNI